jgi:hypothetical protein
MPKKGVMSNREVQIALIENFVNLQKVLTNLTIKFDALSDNLNRLLQIFEISAKSFIKRNEEPSWGREDKELLNKIDTMLEQNKTIAKGLTLMEEKIRHKALTEPSIPSIRPMPRQEPFKAKPLPRI